MITLEDGNGHTIAIQKGILLKDIVDFSKLEKKTGSEYLDSESCRNFASKLTRSKSSLKIGANSHACFQ